MRTATAMILEKLISMKLYRDIADGIVESLMLKDDEWSLVEHENPKQDYYQHVSGNRVFVYSGSLVSPNGVRVNIPRDMEEEISEITILKKRSKRRFNEMREAVRFASESFARDGKESKELDTSENHKD